MGSLPPTSRIQEKAEPIAQSLDKFRNYLVVLTRMQLGDRFRGKIDASDVVQHAYLEAQKHLDGFRGTSDNELLAWLRSILATSLARAMRDLGRQKRDVSRERSLQAALDASSKCLELIADQSSPSGRVQREEQLLLVAEAMAQLPDGQREVMILRHAQGWKLADIAEHLGVSPPAVLGLLNRGAKRLRELIDDRTRS